MKSILSRVVKPVLALALLAGLAPAGEAGNLAPNPEFREGDTAPAGWSLTRGEGQWADREALEIRGGGEGSETWQSDPLEFRPGGLYVFETLARRHDGQGLVVSGPEFANRDAQLAPGEARTLRHVFRVPDSIQNGRLRLGQWEGRGTVRFERVRLAPALPIYRQSGPFVLGAGESIRDGIYRFNGTFGQEPSNAHRPLESATTSFNSTRWNLGGESSQLTYRFGLPGQTFQSAMVRVNVNYHTRGGCQVEVSQDDGKTWQTLAENAGTGSLQADVPDALLPAASLLVRIRPTAGNSNFQVNAVAFEGRLQGAAPDTVGRTAVAELTTEPDGSSPAIESATLADDPATGLTVLRLALRNPADGPRDVTISGSVASEDADERALELGTSSRATLPARAVGEVAVPLGNVAAGSSQVKLSLSTADGRATRLDLPLVVHYLERADYGQRLAELPDLPGGGGIWWCDAGHKVARGRPLPGATGSAVTLGAARNDYEAAQVVVRPARDLTGLTATAGPLQGPGGATLPALSIEVLRVAYHFVAQPTDATGLSAWWPDALPPLREPLTVPAGTNQPLWVLVHVPADAAPGDYSGTLALKADGYSADVPIRLHVWNVTLPERNHVETAFGFTPQAAFQYHNVTTEADRRELLDRYLASFAAHRISPYNPTPLESIRVRFLPDADPPRAELDLDAFDQAMRRALDRYHFTGFRLPLQGLGGGTFHERHDPEIAGYGAETPQYQAMLSSYLGQLETFLRERDWLDTAYIYWFDEPDPKDYDFVRAGMERIKAHAPGLRRMLTEEPVEPLVGAVDIWCPLTPNFDPATAAPARQRGERFWWYVCTGPKAPYATLFIDHPATELRVWLWQTWQRDIDGILVWATNWWTSRTAFPDGFQNPYDDPMSYTAGYGLPPGTRAHWGNGDGRFLYPPEAAATPGRNDGSPILDDPVSSIRWEMLREGIEDYEMLYMLRERLAQRRTDLDPARVREIEALLEVPESITANMTTFTADPAPILERRAEIAEAIESLGP